MIQDDVAKGALVGVEFCRPCSCIPMLCDNQTAIYIASNTVLHEKTEHIKIDCQFFRDAIKKKWICNPCIPSHTHLASVFTKPIVGKNIYTLRNMIDIHSPA